MTNLEKIRSMPIEELAELIDKITSCCADNFVYGCSVCPIFECNGKGFCDKQMIQHWLESEVDGHLSEKQSTRKGREMEKTCVLCGKEMPSTESGEQYCYECKVKYSEDWEE